ncbi:MAG: NHL repeat-containing protein [Candidatus Aminicenantes bacterium]|nr:NHL repeat-containing protein [Candidatus Aminicenantes bacterium]
MTPKNKFILAGVLISLFIITIACQKEKTGWQGMVEEENGIKVVRNPEEPYYGELAIELEEDLVIGSETDEKYMFYRAGGIAVDNQGNIYVVDSGNQRIQKYDRDGNYLQTIGRKGQGPGEFMSPYDIVLDEKGYIYVSEGRKIHVFDPKGNSIQDIVLSNFIMEYSIDSEGNIIASGFVQAERAQNFGIMLINPEGKIIKTIAEYPGMSMVSRKGTAFMFSHEYTTQLSFSPIGKNGAVYGYGSEYKLIVTDFSGETSLIIKKDEPSQSITRREKDKIITDFLESTAEEGREWPRDVVEEGANFPDHRPFFNGIVSDDIGRMYVRRLKSVLDESKEAEFDIFGPEGFYLYRTTLSFMPNLVKDSYLYRTTYSEETGEYKVIRYRIKNWDKIQEGIK